MLRTEKRRKDETIIDIIKVNDETCVTGNHKVLTQSGWKPVENLTLKDGVIGLVGIRSLCVLENDNNG